MNQGVKIHLRLTFGLFHYVLLGDSDFSTDIHSFRFTKLWEVVLIHNAAAKEALKITATHAIPFEAVMEKGKKAQDKKEGKTKENKEGKEKKESKKKKSKTGVTCKSGHPLTLRPPEDSGWFCSASKDPGGCRRALAEKAVASGGISSSRCPFLLIHLQDQVCLKLFQVPFILLPPLCLQNLRSLLPDKIC